MAKSRKRASPANRRISVVPERPVQRPKAQNITNFDRLQILDVYYENKNLLTQEQMIPHLRAKGYTTIVATTLSHDPPAHPERLYEKRQPVLTLPDVDKALCQWVIQKLSTGGARSTGDMNCEKGREFCYLFGYPTDTLEFSHGWLRSFNARMGLTKHVFHGEAASAPLERLEDEHYRLLCIIMWFHPRDAYNVDETAFLYCLVPDSGLALTDMPGLKVDKKRITYVLCVNMDGSHKRAPLIIGRSRQPRCFDKYTAEALGHYYTSNSKAWMVHWIWKSFIVDLNEDMRRQGRYILLLCDN